MPQGGNTGLVGGSVPHEHGDEIVLSLGRMAAVRAVDPVNDTITVDAGCILAEVQAAAAAADRYFPLSLGAEGSCRIGGNLSTNAGGTAVLRYGNARDLVLGLEVVLPDGDLWDGLRGLRKDNTGYDLKHMFIGAEGTLGIITGAVLKLFPRPRHVESAFVGVDDPHAAVELFRRVRDAAGGALTGCELIPRIAIDFTLRHMTGHRDPLAEPIRSMCSWSCRRWPVPSACATPSRTRSPRPSRTVSRKTRRSPPTPSRHARSGASARTWSRRRSPRAARSSTTLRCPCRASPISSPRHRPLVEARIRASASSPSATSATATCIST